jgi:hypothetical protein
MVVASFYAVSPSISRFMIPWIARYLTQLYQVKMKINHRTCESNNRVL